MGADSTIGPAERVAHASPFLESGGGTNTRLSLVGSLYSYPPSERASCLGFALLFSASQIDACLRPLRTQPCFWGCCTYRATRREIECAPALQRSLDRWQQLLFCAGKVIKFASLEFWWMRYERLASGGKPRTRGKPNLVGIYRDIEIKRPDARLTRCGRSRAECSDVMTSRRKSIESILNID